MPGVAFLGTFVWVSSGEAAVVLHVVQRGWPPLPTALLATVGQLTAWLVLFGAGQRIRAVWPWFDRRCERARARWGDRFARHAWVAIAVSGALGLPPTSVAAVLAPGLGIRARVLLPVLFASRFARFLVVALLATGFDHFHARRPPL